MALEHIQELAKEVQDLQENSQNSVEPDKVRALASLALELARVVVGDDDLIGSSHLTQSKILAERIPNADFILRKVNRTASSGNRLMQRIPCWPSG
jgi:hypothetical protein